MSATHEVKFVIGQTQWNPLSYRCHVAILKEDDGTFSAIVLNLPGAGSCGDTEEQAIENVRDAIIELIASYLDAGDEIPWEARYDIPEGVKTKWILVHG